MSLTPLLSAEPQYNQRNDQSVHALKSSSSVGGETAFQTQAGTARSGVSDDRDATDFTEDSAGLSKAGSRQMVDEGNVDRKIPRERERELRGRNP